MAKAVAFTLNLQRHGELAGAFDDLRTQAGLRSVRAKFFGRPVALRMIRRRRIRLLLVSSHANQPV